MKAQPNASNALENSGWWDLRRSPGQPPSQSRLRACVPACACTCGHVAWQTVLSCSPQHGNHPLKNARNRPQLCFHRSHRRSFWVIPALFSKLIIMPPMNPTQTVQRSPKCTFGKPFTYEHYLEHSHQLLFEGGT